MKIYIHNMFCIYKKKIRRARKTAVENNIYNTREELYKLIAIWLNLCTWWMTEIYEFMWDTWASETIWGSLIKYRWRVRMCEIKTFFSKYFFCIGKNMKTSLMKSEKFSINLLSRQLSHNSYDLLDVALEVEFCTS